MWGSFSRSWSRASRSTWSKQQTRRRASSSANDPPRNFSDRPYMQWIKSSLRPSIKTLLKIAVATGLLTSPFWSNALVNSEIEIGFVVREREKLITELLATLANPKETSANRIGALDRLLDLAHSGSRNSRLLVERGVLDVLVDTWDADESTRGSIVSFLNVLSLSESLRPLLLQERLLSRLAATGTIEDNYVLHDLMNIYHRFLTSEQLGPEFLRQTKLRPITEVLSREELGHSDQMVLAKEAVNVVSKVSVAGTLNQCVDSEDDVVNFLRQAFLVTQAQLVEGVARIFANFLISLPYSSSDTDSDVTQAVSHDQTPQIRPVLQKSLQLLHLLGVSLQEGTATSDGAAHILRAVANLSAAASGACKSNLLFNGWYERLLKAALEPESDGRTVLVALTALGNLATSDKDISKRLAEHDILQLKQAIDSNSHLLSPVMPTQQRTILDMQFARLCLQAARVDLDSVSQIMSLKQLVELSTQDVSSTSTRSALMSMLSKFAQDPAKAKMLLGDSIPAEYLDRVANLSGPTIPAPIRRQAVRVVSNLAVADAKTVSARPLLRSALQACSSSKETDGMVKFEAIRGQASISGLALKGTPKYDEGVYLLYPPPNGGSSTTVKSEPAIDIVLIHGVAGHPLSTWRSSTDQTVSWPRDWIPQDIPNCRVLSLSYEVYLSKWAGDSTPLKEQSLLLLKKLKLAAVGNRPVIFVTHSFGGLVAKDLLRYAANNKEFQSIRDQSLGVFFYSTPHRGSHLTELTSYGGGTLKHFFRDTSAMRDLLPTNTYLHDLNDTFCDYAPNVSTFSFGEGESCFFEANPINKLICYQVVTPESALFTPVGKCNGTHGFELLSHCDHRQVCKPANKDDARYKLLVQFIMEQLKRKGSSLLSAATTVAVASK